MNIEISAKEYRDLLDILHLADVVMSGHRTEEDKRTEGHRALIQKFYALARVAGLDRLINFDKSEEKYFPTRDFEQSSVAHVVLDEFGDHYFWDELISRLTERDAAQMAGGTVRVGMNEVDRQHAKGHIRQRYLEEFSANGVANLAVIERFSPAEGMTLAKTSD
jgi:hypothetical protein